MVTLPVAANGIPGISVSIFTPVPKLSEVWCLKPRPAIISSRAQGHGWASSHPGFLASEGEFLLWEWAGGQEQGPLKWRAEQYSIPDGDGGRHLCHSLHGSVRGRLCGFGDGIQCCQACAVSEGQKQGREKVPFVPAHSSRCCRLPEWESANLASEREPSSVGHSRPSAPPGRGRLSVSERSESGVHRLLPRHALSPGDAQYESWVQGHLQGGCCRNQMAPGCPWTRRETSVLALALSLHLSCAGAPAGLELTAWTPLALDFQGPLYALQQWLSTCDLSTFGTGLLCVALAVLEPWNSYIDQAGLQLRDLPASASAFTTTPGNESPWLDWDLLGEQLPVALTTGSSFLGCMFLLRIVVWEPCIHVVPDLWVCGLENSQCRLLINVGQILLVIQMSSYPKRVGLFLWLVSWDLTGTGSKDSVADSVVLAARLPIAPFTTVLRSGSSPALESDQASELMATREVTAASSVTSLSTIFPI
ncbi:hypothetical protein U0070_014898 [Myodes glareolus]|uniref:Uncharacterized protein n=1 Tax=Myodes glareolus TaxID=447135 RepID=A0AAW0HDF3_MYOGA